MATVTTWIDCYLDKPVKVQYLNGNLFSADSNAHVLGVKVYSTVGNPASLSGTVSASIVRSDGVTVTQNGTLSGNECSVSIPAEAYAVPGTVIVSIKLTTSGVVTTLGVFACVIYDSAQGSIVDPGTIIPSIEALIIAIDTAIASIPADYSSLWTSLAPAYSTSSAYSVGQYVTYNGGLYRCTTAIGSGGESWTSRHWTAVNIGAELYNLKNATVQFIDDCPAAGWDVNDLVQNGLWTIRASRKTACSHLPENTIRALTVIVRTTTTNVSWQRVIDANGTCWTRTVNSSTHEVITDWANNIRQETGDGLSVVMSQKAVSDELSSLETEMMSTIDELCYYDVPSESGSFVQGTIDSSDGVIYEVNPRLDRIANKEFYKVADIANVSVSEGFQILCGAYSIADTAGFISVSSWASSFNTFTGNYVRFAVRRSNGNNISPDAVTGFAVAYKPVPIKKVVDGKAAIITDTVQNVAIASVPDAASNLPLSALKIAVEPVQDLHGQANPYPAGGGKNLLDDTQVKHGAYDTGGTFSPNGNYLAYEVNLSAGTYTFSTDLADCYIVRYHDGQANTQYMTAAQKVTFTMSVSGTFKVTIRNTSTSDLSNVQPKSMIESGSTATPYAPYSNICPITGWTGANVQRTGKNLVSNAQSASLGNNWQYFKTSGLRLKANTYTLSIVAETAPSFFYVRPFGQTSEEIAHSNSKNVTFTLAEEQSVWFDAYWVGGTGKPSSAPNIQLELGSTETEYEPYQGTVYPISWQTEAGTVYGGTLDPITGKLIVTMKGVNLDDLTWSVRYTGTSNKTVSATLPEDYFGYTNESPIVMAEEYVSVQGIAGISALSDPDNLGVGLRWYKYQTIPYTATVYCVLDKNNTPNGKMVYKLATPVTIQLDPVEIKTLTGTNNLWANCGNILLMEYGCDTKLYIEKQFLESSANGVTF